MQLFGSFIIDQLLKMQWLSDLMELLITSLFGEEFYLGRIGQSLHFFLYDFIKIGLLLCFLIFIISYIQSYFPPERTKKILGRYKGLWANLLGALLGTVTPFCSCSSIPLFIGFTRAGISTGVAFSFLISSPLVDLGALILLTSLFGFPLAIAYVVAGLILAVIGGTIIEHSKAREEIEPFVMQGVGTINIDVPELKQMERIQYAFDQMKQTYRKVWIYILVGVGIGAFIHNWIPEEIIQTVLGDRNPFSVLLAVMAGAPMYADIFGTIPVADALFTKGVQVGTIIAFMMAVTALSIPSMVMLRRVIKPKLLGMFFGIVIVGIIIIGYLFNAFAYLFI